MGLWAPCYKTQQEPDDPLQTSSPEVPGAAYRAGLQTGLLGCRAAATPQPVWG